MQYMPANAIEAIDFIRGFQNLSNRLSRQLNLPKRAEATKDIRQMSKKISAAAVARARKNALAVLARAEAMHYLYLARLAKEDKLRDDQKVTSSPLAMGRIVTVEKILAPRPPGAELTERVRKELSEYAKAAPRDKRGRFV